MPQITLSNDTQSVKLTQEEQLIKLSQSLQNVTIRPSSIKNLTLAQTNSTIRLAQAAMSITFKQNGLRGIQGIPGNDGEDGAAATVAVGTTLTGDAGTSAEVTNSGTTSAAVLDFVIPKGDKGDQGDPGVDGDKNYVMNFTNTDFITVNHNLNKYPSVTVINSANDEVVGDADYVDVNTITVTFIGSFSGKVTCN